MHIQKHGSSPNSQASIPVSRCRRDPGDTRAVRAAGIPTADTTAREDLVVVVSQVGLGITWEWAVRSLPVPVIKRTVIQKPRTRVKQVLHLKASMTAILGHSPGSFLPAMLAAERHAGQCETHYGALRRRPIIGSILGRGHPVLLDGGDCLYCARTLRVQPFEGEPML